MREEVSVSKGRALRAPGPRLSARLAPWLGLVAMVAVWARGRRGKAGDAAPPGPPTPEQIDAAEPGRGRAARSPWDIPHRGWRDILWRSYREMGRDRLPALAGGVTFYVLLATFPAIAAFVSLYGMFSDVDSVERQLTHMSSVFPQDAVNVIGEEMLRLATQRHGTLGAAFAVSTLISAWSANAGMKALFDGVNIAYDEVEKRPWLQRSLITYAATVLALIFLTAITTVTVAAPVLFHAIGLHGVHLWWAPVRWLAVYLLAGAAFTLIYRHGPSRVPARWRWVAPGGFAAALLWMAGSLGFTTYVDNFTHFGVTYGSLGAMIGFMLWIWVSVMVVLIGAEFSAEIEHQTARDTTRGKPLPLGERGATMADTVGKAFTVTPRQARDYFTSFAGRQLGHVARFFRGLFRLG
jgi:membrane protein